jgi:mono/diheme cytochrome c family protein
MTPTDHMKIGWIYFLFAWLSLFFINGIITFMLTPGAWLATGRLWDAFFNPTFWPSLVMRSCIAVMLAGLYALLVAARSRPEAVKVRRVRAAAWSGLLGLATALPALGWYWKALPPAITTAAIWGLPTPMLSLHYSYWFAGALVAFLIFFGLITPRRMHIVVAVIIMAAGLGWFGSFEWFRESIRKPYIIVGYMYGNAIEVGNTGKYQQEGYLAHIRYRTGNDSADLFRHACRSCHTLQGYKPLKPAFDGTDRAFIAAIIRGAHLMRGNMPPFLGGPREADEIAAYIEGCLDRRSVAAIYGFQGVELGQKLFQIRCAKCHPMGGRGDKSKSLAGLTREDYQNLLNAASDLGVGMPAFTADDADRRALIEYLMTIKAGGTK